MKAYDNTPERLEDPVGDILGCSDELETPAFVYDEEAIVQRCQYLRRTADEAQCSLLYSLKPLTLVNVLRLIAPHVDGFSTSSLFEAILARGVIGDVGTVHLTTPGLRRREIGTLAGLCDYVSFNSLSQWHRHKGEMGGKVKCGLRINPHRSFVKDPRYDPCREHSKLGVPIEDLIGAAGPASDVDGLDGVHVHGNCDSPDFAELLATVRHLDGRLGDLLHKVDWINLGGGYLFDEEGSNIDQFIESVAILRARHGLDVFIEPGAAIVREAAYLVSTVLDIFYSDGASVAILDTSVNHMPEVFEYQYRPDILGNVEDGRFTYLLGGSTCLAGDVFGVYSFTKPLDVGSRIVFTDVGAYTLVKAHTFNGLNLPSIYALDAEGVLTPVKHFTFEEFAYRWEIQPHVPV